LAERGWRFIDTGIDNGYMNMAIDEAILEAHLHGRCPQTLRVYGWDPPALSLGYFQDMETEIEIERCGELGVDVVRRLTGGRAVFHDDELTYSVVVSGGGDFPTTLAESYGLLNEGLIAAYSMLGVEVRMAANPQEPSSAACFSSAGPADLTWRGRKVCGSAQFRRDGVLLQHGSLPITSDVQAFFSLLKFSSDAARDRAQADYGQTTASLREVSGNGMGWQELKEALIEGFQTALGIRLYEGRLSPEERGLARELAEKKYKAFGWSYHGR